MNTADIKAQAVAEYRDWLKVGNGLSSILGVRIGDLPKDSKIEIRISKEEKALIAESARQNGETVSSWLLHVAAVSRLPAVAGILDAIREDREERLRDFHVKLDARIHAVMTEGDHDPTLS